MENLKVVIFDGTTGKVIERKMNEEEIHELDESNRSKQEFRLQQEAKEAARSSALAKLAALGLTEEEIAAL
jgi:hypothetical protein